MHATHQFFLTERSLYLIVLNGRSGGEDADVEYWLKVIESFGGDSPVVIVLNKIRSHPFDLNRRGLLEKYPARIRAFVPTDCEDGTGIDELRRTIVREADRLPHLRDAFRESWFCIKDTLSSINEKYLPFEQFRGICASHGETDSQSQESLATALHCLGVALNYRQDSRLKDMHVLNPQWITGGIYRILNSDLLQSRHGELTISDLQHVLDQVVYPSSVHEFLVNLMRKFDLCFRFQEPRDDTYLIPELLSKEQTELATQCELSPCLRFRYSYPVWPEGLLPRFIVRTHSLSNGQHRWRTGVVLEFEGNQAVVKADPEEKQVHISVTGQREGRRRLLAVIRSDFERIHADIPGLNPVGSVPIPEDPVQAIPYEELRGTSEPE